MTKIEVDRFRHLPIVLRVLAPLNHCDIKEIYGSKARALVVSLAVLAAFALAASAVGAADVFSGTWKVNAAKSKTSGGLAVNEHTVTIEAVDDGLRVTTNSVTKSGQKHQMAFIARFDGAESAFTDNLDGKPSPQPTGMTASSKKLDDHALAVTYHSKGKVVSQLKWAVSKDGKTLAVTESATNSRGQQIVSTLVYDRQ